MNEKILLAEIESFCKLHDIADSRFGRDAAKNSQFVYDLRKGRSPTLRKVTQVKEWMARYNREKGKKK